MDDNPLSFKLLGKYENARCGLLKLPHCELETPVYMPVGTYGALKGITNEEIFDMGFKLTLGNTYHLSNTPGAEMVEKMGGLYKFANYKGGLLTDSGGFQMVSLLSLAEITEEGVTFSNPKDLSSRMMLTPEESIRKQNQIGADIIMALDDVVTSVSDDSDRVKEACERTVRWIDRCIDAHAKPREQSLFGIVQGGLDPGLRTYCLNEMIKRDLPGYAIGGLAGGEDKSKFWKVVLQCTQRLPHDKPRYLMGVGYPIDLVVCSALGCDMYDSVFPSRVARFGIVFTCHGFINLNNKKFKDDMEPIESSCACTTCASYSRAYLSGMIGASISACSLLTVHNFFYIGKLMSDLRESIRQGRFYDFVKEFVNNTYEGDVIPPWVIDALNAVGCDV